ncbi:MAG: ABC transporter ATP-binding protein [Cellvibrionales bacterium]|jgi:branched-chain amino acid transport system ATP-binding protein|nr:ABC transporter ATP-binding protein [Cellvibrionales bacterium]
MNNPSSALLDIRHLDVSYGAIKALRGVSLQVMPGELVCLIGANGAGKSTLLKSIAGLLTPSTGEIHFAGCNLRNTPAHALVSQGLALVPEGRGIFGDMSVLENLQMGAYHRQDKAGIRQDIEHAYTLFPRLAERQQQAAGTLSGGEQQMVAIARALMSKPRLLLLDEPSMGLAPLLVRKILEVIATINREGVSVLLVEQNANAALSLASRGYVMEHGEITLQDSAQNLLHNPAVKAAYLGG